MSERPLEPVDERLFGRSLDEVSRSCAEAGLGKVAEMIEKRYAEVQLTLSRAVRACALDPNLLNVRLKAAVELTFHQLVIRRRVLAAADRLASDPRTLLSKIAWTCGFGSLRSMERNFSQLLGVTPSRYRRRASRKGER